MLFFTDIKGPTHTFNGLTANFYISTRQGTCSIDGKDDAKVDADYFCSSFYGEEYKSISYREGNYDDSGKLGYQMHKGTACRSSGESIEGTDCSGVMCKIEKIDNNYKGLFDIQCSKNQGNI